MARSYTPEEVEQRHIDSFPSGTGELFHLISTKVSILHLHWKNYRALYGTTPERIDLLNYTASYFFVLVEDVLRDDILLRISKLIEGAGSGRKKKVSIKRLLEEIKEHILPEDYDKISKNLRELDNYCKKLKNIRNKQIAHSDLNAALDENIKKSLGVSRDYIEDILLRIRNIIGSIEKLFMDSSTYYEYILSTNDAEQLISVLERARNFEEEERERVLGRRSKYKKKETDN